MIDLDARLAALPEKPRKIYFASAPDVGLYPDEAAAFEYARAEHALACHSLLRDFLRERCVEGCRECGGNGQAQIVMGRIGAMVSYGYRPCPACADARVVLEATK